MSRGLRWFAVRAVLVAAIVPLVAQEPTFRSGVDLVTVDATVFDRDGDPIENLGPDDFSLEVDGRRRHIVSAQFVSQAARGNRRGHLEAAHFTSNEGADTGRLVVMAVDEAHIRRLEGRQALQAAATFIDTLDPSDRIGVAGLTRQGALDFTRDRVALKRRLGSLVGQTDPVLLQFNLGLSEALEIADGSRARLADAVLRECGRALTDYVNLARAADDAGAGRDGCPEQVEQESRGIAQHAHIQARISLNALEALVTSLKNIPGPKTVVLLSEGMVTDPRRLDLSRVAVAAQAAQAAIYVLQLEVPTFEAAQDRISPTLVRDLQVRGDGLARLAGAARGAVFRLAGNDPRPFRRIARELGGYYLLAFEPIDGERDGRSHRIRVALARGGGELRARDAFTFPVEPPSIQARGARLVTLLRTLTVSTELPVRVATYAYAEPNSPDLRVVVSAEAEVGQVGRVGQVGSASSALLGFVLIDARGVIAATAVREALAGHYAFSAVVAPGKYTLRAGAIDSMGRQGSVERPFDARVAVADGVRVSDLILAPPPARPDDPLEPLIDRVSGPTMVAYLEMQADERERLPDAVQIVIAREDVSSGTLPAPIDRGRVEGGAQSRVKELVRVAADLTQPFGSPSGARLDSPARAQARPFDSLALDQGRQDKPDERGGWVIARGVVPTTGLPPGRYVALAEVVVNGRTIARVPRPFAIP